ncbi:hypothetical protein C8J57DRAFT_1533433 [Mycena rebaudengoi]|nr:hypothetical protein C8J57DRAFT_1533433 [Mycena rebaudengoi]
MLLSMRRWFSLSRPRLRSPQPPSATLNSMHTARGFSAPAPGPSTASPFRVHVKRRQEDIETNRKQNSTPGHPFQSKKFHPAERSQINGDLNPHDSRKRKAKAQSPTVTRMHDVQRGIASHKYNKPTAPKLMELNRLGYVKNVQLHTDKPSKSMAQTLAPVRDAGPGYKNIIFIALHPLAPNLPFPGVDVTLDSPDHDITSANESSGSDDEMADDEGGGSSTGGVKQPVLEHRWKLPLMTPSREPEARRMTLMVSVFSHGSYIDDWALAQADSHDEDGFEFPLDEEEAGSLSASSHRYTSLGPQHNQAGYAKRTEMVEDHTPLSHLEGFNSMKPLLADLIDSTVAEQLSVDILFAKLAKCVLVPLESLNALATHIRSVGEDAKSRAELRREFDKVFGLGPGGFTVVFPILSFLYEGLARIRKAGFALKTAESFETDHFRLTYHRFLWDPKGGFRELAHVLQRYDDKIPVNLSVIRRTRYVPLDNIALQLDSSSSLRQSLEDAFESATDAGNMKHAVVVGGEYGLRRFYAVVIEQLLDTIDRTDYEDVFKLLNDTSRALARKCANYVKSKPGPGAKPKPSPVPEDENGPRTRAQTAASESEDYMPKPPPKPKGCWVDVNSSPSPSPPPAPPSSEEQHNLDLEDAEDLMTLEWFGLRRRILKRLPHPNPQKRDTLKNLNQLNHTQQFRQLSKANQNVTQSARWQEVTTKIMTAINDKRR